MTKAVIKEIKNRFQTKIRRVSENWISEETDTLAIEEPLEIRVGVGKKHRAVSITMRTPAHDVELAVGFLFTEGILNSPEQIKSVKHCGKFPNNQNTIRIDLAENVKFDFEKLSRNFYTTSSCGVCGKSSLEALKFADAKPIADKNFPIFSAETVHQLSRTLRQNQTVFKETGGIHAAAIFETDGSLVDLKEDVGRHNAVDKLIGKQFITNSLPLSDKILFLSGRASFELIQKAVTAQIPIVCAVGAPSSLAVEAAREFGVTLLGFVRDNRFNIYSGKERFAKI